MIAILKDAFLKKKQSIFKNIFVKLEKGNDKENIIPNTNYVDKKIEEVNPRNIILDFIYGFSNFFQNTSIDKNSSYIASVDRLNMEQIDDSEFRVNSGGGSLIIKTTGTYPTYESICTECIYLRRVDNIVSGKYSGKEGDIELIVTDIKTGKVYHNNTYLLTGNSFLKFIIPLPDRACEIKINIPEGVEFTYGQRLFIDYGTDLKLIKLNEL